MSRGSTTDAVVLSAKNLPYCLQKPGKALIVRCAPVTLTPNEALGEYGPISVQLGFIIQLPKNNIN